MHRLTQRTARHGALAAALVGALALSGLAWADVSASLQSAIELPEHAQALRDKGVDADQVAYALAAAREAKVPAAELSELFASVAPLVEKHGPIQGFSGFVKDRLDEGLRGEALVAALTKAHETDGKPAARPTSPAPDTRPSTRPDPKPLVRPGSGTRPSPGTRPRPDSAAPSPGTRPRPGSTAPSPGTRPRPDSSAPSPRPRPGSAK